MLKQKKKGKKRKKVNDITLLPNMLDVFCWAVCPFVCFDFFCTVPTQQHFLVNNLQRGKETKFTSFNTTKLNGPTSLHLSLYLASGVEKDDRLEIIKQQLKVM